MLQLHFIIERELNGTPHLFELDLTFRPLVSFQR